jgi:hypothetical protein
MVQTLPFENSARDLVNFGIAFYNQFSLVLEDMQRKTADGYQELVNRGAQDKSELAEGTAQASDRGPGFPGSDPGVPSGGESPRYCSGR